VPAIIRYDHDIVAERGNDSFFLQMTPIREKILFHYDESIRAAMLDWFKSWDIEFEVVAHRGWLMGDPGRYHVAFSGWDDPLLKLWCEQFENAAGESLQPDKYVMEVYPHEQYLKDLAEGMLEPDDDP
jgi:hypothetical protein